MVADNTLASDLFVHDDELRYAVWLLLDAAGQLTEESWNDFCGKWENMPHEAKTILMDTPKVRSQIDSMRAHKFDYEMEQRRSSRRRYTREREGNRLMFRFPNGRSLLLDPNKLSDEMKMELMLHGLSAKVGDSAADPKLDACETMLETWEMLKRGQWTKPRPRKL